MSLGLVPRTDRRPDTITPSGPRFVAQHDDTEDLLSETPETPTSAADPGGSPVVPDAAPAPAAKAPARRAAKSARGSRRGPAKKSSARKAPAKRAAAASSSSAPSARAAAGSLASALRELVGGIEDEVRNITSLVRQIDDHGRALNDLRADGRAAAAAPRTTCAPRPRTATSAPFLDDTIQPTLPQVGEDFPERIYGS
jgi:hypothetical protein